MNFNLSEIKIENDEFTKDGLIYCKKCLTPRIWKSDDGQAIVRCLCKCQAQERDKQLEIEEQERRLQKLEKLKQNSLLGPKFVDVSFETLDLNRPQDFVIASKRCKRFCENWQRVKEEGCGIYLYGDTGLGKSHLTACICNYLLKRFVPVIITSFLEISKRLRESYQTDNETENSIIERFAEVDLLILDDVGVEKLKKENSDSFMQEKIYDLINRRYLYKKPTIFTSNYSLDELLQERGFQQRTIDRINEMSLAVIKLEGESYRRTIIKNQERIF